MNSTRIVNNYGGFGGEWVTKTELKKMSTPACHPQYEMTIPAGTACRFHPEVNGFVVTDISKIIGGNSHDLKHHWVVVERSEIERP